MIKQNFNCNKLTKSQIKHSMASFIYYFFKIFFSIDSYVDFILKSPPAYLVDFLVVTFYINNL